MTDTMTADAVARDETATAEIQRQVAERPEKSPAGKAMSDANWHRFDVDIWITNLNSYEFGIYKRSRNRAKSRQFSTDMDIFAEVIENGKRTALLGYREDLWKNKTGMDKRLAVKMFTEGLNWRASMDLMIGRSLQLTIGARGIGVSVYAINTNDDSVITYLERSANKWPIMPENYSFFVMRKGKPCFYRLRHDFFSVGGDYSLFDEKNQKVGHIDGKIITLGGYWKCKVRKDHADRKLLDVMKLFTATIGFKSAARRHMHRLWADVRTGKLEPSIERHESEYYLNPRRVR
ncbi:hypothetical protein ACO2I3_01525 [Leptospira interrogans]